MVALLLGAAILPIFVNVQWLDWCIEWDGKEMLMVVVFFFLVGFCKEEKRMTVYV